MHDIERWEERRSAGMRLAARITTDMHMLTSRPGLPGRQLAAAGLARCVRLLSAAEQIIDLYPDVVGALARPLFEVWLTSAWALFDPEAAWPALRDGYKRSVGVMNESAQLGLLGVDGWKEAPRAPHIEQIARALTALLAERGDEASDAPVSEYNLVYRNESLRGSHGGLGATIGHLVDGGEWFGVRGDRADAGAQGLFVWAAALVAVLAGWVYDEFGLDRRLIDECSAPLADE